MLVQSALSSCVPVARAVVFSHRTMWKVSRNGLNSLNCKRALKRWALLLWRADAISLSTDFRKADIVSCRIRYSGQYDGKMCRPEQILKSYPGLKLKSHDTHRENQIRACEIQAGVQKTLWGGNTDDGFTHCKSDLPDRVVEQHGNSWNTERWDTATLTWGAELGWQDEYMPTSTSQSKSVIH